MTHAATGDSGSYSWADELVSCPYWSGDFLVSTVKLQDRLLRLDYGFVRR